MEMQNMEQGKVIGNVGILDLRNATETSVAEISRIGNVGAVLYSRETAGLVTGLNIGNVGTSVEVSPDASIVTGLVVFTRDVFKGQEAPLDLVVAGPVVVNPDVPAEDIEIRSNIISGIDFVGIRIGNQAKNIRVEGNTIDDVTEYGIYGFLANFTSSGNVGSY